QDLVQAFGQAVRVRHPVRDAGLDDLAFGAHDALRDRGLRHQKPACDLAGCEAYDRTERQRQLRFAAQRRMAAREDQAEPVVHLVGVLRRRTVANQQRQLLIVVSLAAPVVDGTPPRCRQEPGRGIGGQTVHRPVLQGGHHRVLDQVLGKREVAQQPDQRRRQPAGLVSDNARQDRLDAPAGYLLCRSALQSTGAIGRTPPLWPVAGHVFAISMAASRSGTSTMPKPPIVSLASTNGPSVRSGLALSQTTVVAVRAGCSSAPPIRTPRWASSPNQRAIAGYSRFSSERAS